MLLTGVNNYTWYRLARFGAERLFLHYFIAEVD